MYLTWVQWLQFSSNCNEKGEIKKRRPSANINRHVGPLARHSWDRFKRSVTFDDYTNFTIIDGLSEKVGAPRSCFALFVECMPHMISPHYNPDFNIIPDTVITEPPAIDSNDTNFTTPNVDEIISTTEATKPNQPIKPGKLHQSK